ncbi:MAG: response regulator transcription factor [bacterium]|nr:response regulator transcription factor [bacterium]
MDRKPAIAIIDDHPMLRAGLSGVLASRGFEVVAQVDSGDDFVAVLQEGESVDLVLLDIDLGDENGLAVLQRLRKIRPELFVVILSHHDEAHIVQTALDRGAHGFILKRESGETLAVTLKSILQGVTPVLSPMIQVALRRDSERKKPIDELSARELEVLRLLAMGYRYREIADDLGVSKRTVEYHSQALREKLDAESLVDLVRIADEYLPRESLNKAAREKRKREDGGATNT